MTAVLLDTHAWAWSLAGDARLSAPALAVMSRADRVLVSPISVFEIAQTVRRGEWPEMPPFIDRLPFLLEQQGGAVAGFGPAICLLAGMMDWPHRDPFDRLLAATARQDSLPLASADAAFDRIVARIR